jgi:hypothetical protein
MAKKRMEPNASLGGSKERRRILGEEYESETIRSVGIHISNLLMEMLLL